MQFMNKDESTVRKKQDKCSCLIRDTDNIEDLSRVFASLAHDLRNPIQGILLGIDFFMNSFEVQSSSTWKENFFEISKSLNELNWIIDNIDAVAALLDANEEDEPYTSSINVSETIQSLLNEYRSHYPNLDFAFSGDSGLSVSACPDQFRRILDNIIRLLIRYCDENESFFIETEDGENDVFIRGSAFLKTAGNPPSLTEVSRLRLDRGLALSLSRMSALRLGGDFSEQIDDNGKLMLTLKMPGRA